MSEKCFRVGFGRVDITPTESVPLAGYGNTSHRMSNNVINRLYSTCLAFTDEDGETVLLYHNDLQESWTDIMTEAREKISEAVGIPMDHIMISATHIHTGPDAWNRDEPSILRYNACINGWLIRAAQEALADRKPATVSVGRTVCPNMNFGRHYMLHDGTYCGPSFGDDTGKTYVCHAVDVDHTMQAIKFTREGGKPIVLVNWQTHPTRCGGGKKLDIASDVVGVIRQIVEEKEDALVAYFSGASGNVEIRSRIKGENVAHDLMSHGTALANYALEILENLKPVQTGKVRITHRVHTGTVNHTEDHKVEDARKIQKIWQETRDSALTIAAGKPYGINSGYHAGAIISKSKMPLTYDVDVWALSLGDVAFAIAPYEMFDANGKFIKANSPYEMTFIATCANGNLAYIPSAFFYTLDCYERNFCRFTPGIGEELADQYVEMLRELKEA